MPTHRDPRRLRHFVAAALFGLFTGVTHAAPWTLDALLARLAQQKSGQATFVEKKTLTLLDAPVESSGTLSFTAPDRLEKRTLRPRPELVRLQGDTLVVEQAGKAPMTLKLASYPEAAAFVDSIRATLAGDRQALEATYRLSFSGEPTAWQLILLPRYSRMSDLISRIVIRGREGDVQRIDFDMADGDRSEMRIQRTTP
ncbi:MAG: LolA-related protein [Candidatus Dactylopiibacterium sp.]|nr:LolA-related protein [Candidatus Dactylopiibacterium sp.]